MLISAGDGELGRGLAQEAAFPKCQFCSWHPSHQLFKEYQLIPSLLAFPAEFGETGDVLAQLTAFPRPRRC